MVGRTLGHYRVLEKLGEGGMGEVYLAEDSKLERKVALKVLPPEMAENRERLERFEREAKAIAALNHPNIVSIHSIEAEDGVHFLTMELVEGESLGDLIPAEGLSLEQFFDLAIPIADALSEAHEQGIVHRDLKPANIMVDAKGRPKILDFGLAKLRRTLPAELASEAPTEAMTEPGLVMGTYPYMSPEQAEGREANHRSDLFSFGIVLYEMVTGERPFQGDSPASLISSILKDEPTPVVDVRSGLPEGLAEILMRCLEKRPAVRYESAAELRKVFEELRRIVESGVSYPVAREIALPGFLTEEEVEEAPPPVFVGRERELARLDQFLDKALGGQGQVVFVTGEAGTGKTALVSAFLRQALESRETLVAANGGCYAHTGAGDPYVPFRRIVSMLAGDVANQWATGSISGLQARRLWEMVPLTAESISRQAPDLVDIFVPGQVVLDHARKVEPRAPWIASLSALVERKAALPPDVTLQQAALFTQVAALLQTLAESCPLLLVVEDLHWSDAGSVNLLFQVAKGLRAAPVLVIGTYRPSEIGLGREEARHPLETVVHELQRERGDLFVALGQSGDRAFVDEFVDSEPNQLGEGFRSALFERTQGHALFTTELLHDMQERGVLQQSEAGAWVESPGLDWEALPARVEGAIGERIARLSEELRELLTVASVEGEAFTAEVLSRVREADTRRTVRRLSQELEKRHRLVAASGLKRVNSNRLSLYRFRHVLFQRYLYNDLDEAERAYLHEDVGRVLEELYGEHTEEIAPQLARHFREAGEWDRTIRYLEQAGSRAAEMSANEEAIKYLNQAVELLGQLPASMDRDRQELSLLTAQYSPVVATTGFGSEQTGRLTARAAELADRFRDDKELLPVLWFLTVYYGSRADFSKCIQTGDRMLELATEVEDELQKTMAYWVRGLYGMYIGELETGLEYEARTIAFCGPEPLEAMARLYGLEPGVASRFWHAFISLFLGFPDRARAEIEMMLERAGKLDHPGTQAFALFYASLLYSFTDLALAIPLIENCLEVSTRHHLIEFYALSLMAQGRILALEGRVEDGLNRHLEGDQVFQAAGSLLAQSGIKATEALYLGLLGRFEEAFEAVETGLNHVESSGERLYGPELWRTKAGLLAASGASDERVEDCLNQSLIRAQDMKATFFEVRAANDLADLMVQQGRMAEARQLLEPIYERFTEGFDIPDLQKARALLDDLASGQE